MVIECSNLGKLAAVLMKMQEETDYKWPSGDKPTANMVCMEPMSWPVWIVVDIECKTITWSEEKIISEEYNMTDDEFLALDLTLSPKNEDAKIVSNDPVNHPSHYTQEKVECIDAMEQVLGREAVMHYCLGATFKYLWRRKLKENEEQDIQKSLWYFDKAKELINR